VTLKSGKVIEAELLAFRKGKLTLRRDAKPQAVKASAVREVLFLKAKKPPVAPKPPKEDDEAALLNRLEREFYRHRPTDMLSLAKELAGQHDSDLLNKLMARFRRQMFSRQIPKRRKFVASAALTSLRVYVDPPEKLRELRRVVQKRMRRRGANEYQVTLAQEVLNVIDERMRAYRESGYRKRKNGNRRKPGETNRGGNDR